MGLGPRDPRCRDLDLPQLPSQILDCRNWPGPSVLSMSIHRCAYGKTNGKGLDQGHRTGFPKSQYPSAPHPSTLPLFLVGPTRGRCADRCGPGGRTRFTLRLSAAERARQSRIMYMSRPGMRSRSMALPIKAEAMT